MNRSVSVPTASVTPRNTTIASSPSVARGPEMKMSDLRSQSTPSGRPKVEDLLAKEETFMQIDLLEQVAKELRDTKVNIIVNCLEFICQD